MLIYTLYKTIFSCILASVFIVGQANFFGKPIPKQSFFHDGFFKDQLKIPDKYLCFSSEDCAVGVTCNKDYPNLDGIPYQSQEGFCSCFRGIKGVDWRIENRSTKVMSASELGSSEPFAGYIPNILAAFRLVRFVN